MGTSKSGLRNLSFGSSRLVLRIEEVLPSDLRLLDEAVDGIALMIRCAGWQDHVEDIDLALREALANAIIHGNRCDQDKVVRVCGDGFDPDQLPDPCSEEGLKANHGRGIFIIKEIMDDVQFEFDPGTAIYMYPQFHSQLQSSIPECNT